MPSARVKIIKETLGNDRSSGWRLCFQWCRYIHDGKEVTLEDGYRFIWRRPNGNLQAARGQARLPSIQEAMDLMDQAKKEGWGDYNGDLSFPDTPDRPA